MISRDELKESLPTHLKSAATQDLTDKLNNLTSDPEFNQVLRENFLSYTSVLKEGRFKISDYLNAVAYVSLKLMKFSNQDAFKIVFAQRYQAYVAKGLTEQEISGYVSNYNKNKLVNLVLEQTLIPTWVLNADTYQQAINEQAFLMKNAKSEMVRTQAANSILTHLKKPETKHQVDLNLGVQQDAGLEELRGMLRDLAQTQQNAITGGINTQTIAHQNMAPKKDLSDVPDAECIEPDTK